MRAIVINLDDGKGVICRDLLRGDDFARSILSLNLDIQISDILESIVEVGAGIASKNKKLIGASCALLFGRAWQPISDLKTVYDVGGLNFLSIDWSTQDNDDDFLSFLSNEPLPVRVSKRLVNASFSIVQDGRRMFLIPKRK